MTAAAMTTANSWSSRPTMPPMNSTGRNTAASEAVIETMVKPISRAPRRAASIRPMPSSRWRTMFSSITMASSTTKPTARVSAISERLSIEWPSTYMTMNVPRMDMGTARLGMMVADRLRRNRKMTSTTSAMARIRVNCTSWTEPRIETDRS